MSEAADNLLAQDRIYILERRNERLRGAIQMALAHDHYPGCTCSRDLKNHCDERRLRSAIEDA